MEILSCLDIMYTIVLNAFLTSLQFSVQNSAVFVPISFTSSFVKEEFHVRFHSILEFVKSYRLTVVFVTVFHDFLENKAYGCIETMVSENETFCQSRRTNDSRGNSCPRTEHRVRIKIILFQNETCGLQWLFQCTVVTLQMKIFISQLFTKVCVLKRQQHIFRFQRREGDLTLSYMVTPANASQLTTAAQRCACHGSTTRSQCCAQNPFLSLCLSFQGKDKMHPL